MSKKGYEQLGVAMTCRGFAEYMHMFGLKEQDLSTGSILDVAGGGSSFTAEARAKGYDAFAVDPRYASNTEEWAQEAAREIDTSTEKLARLAAAFDWSYYGDIANHRRGREESLRIFQQHAMSEESGSCYYAGKLPQLPFGGNRFSIVLCSHFLFLYGDQFNEEFHREAVRELMRITKPGGQIRIYPLITLDWKRYPALDDIISFIESEGGRTRLLQSQLPFIPGSEQYLIIDVK